MTTALYRRYRPETFAEVIGQEHVTGPLMQALRSGRVNHAYLFSGPRGCGKTTSARILARTLNCAANTPETPIDTPCGTCPSCVDLARGGTGSLDVVEIDAASHGGVDDARELRERATFAPARDRYKIFIIDEAHMVTGAGFNALLKIVEEPPPHIKFIFATTEPDKVIGTIRSRTHHYPFRLVPPDVLGPYLTKLAGDEGVELAPGVVPLIVRAGGGSVRDSLSVLDQLIAGASGGVVNYELAVSLLGYTHSSLLDDVVDAIAARDGGSMFRVIEQVISSGHAPARFVDDLLERFRDLIVIAVSGESAAAVLRDVPADQMALMQASASRLGVAELSRAADLTNQALTEMHGATSPRMHLELLGARLLLPGADAGSAGLAARIERLERGGIAAAGGAVPPVVSSGSTTGTSAIPAVTEPNQTRHSAGGEAASQNPAPAAPSSGMTGAAAVRAALQAAAPVAAPPVVEPDETAIDSATQAPTEPAVTTEVVRRRWNEVLANISNVRAAGFLREHAQVVELSAGEMKLGFAPETFDLARRGNTQTISEAVYQTLGVQVSVQIVPNPTSPTGALPAVVEVPPRRSADEELVSQNPEPVADPVASVPPPVETTAIPVTEEPSVIDAEAEDAAWLAGEANVPAPAMNARQAAFAQVKAESGATPVVEDEPEPFDEISHDDEDITDSTLSGIEAAKKILGATVIEETSGD